MKVKKAPIKKMIVYLYRRHKKERITTSIIATIKSTLLFQEYCKMSSLCHVFLLSFTFLHLLPCVPICVATWMNPLLSVNIAGILNPTAQQFPSPLAKRSSSANIPFLRLTPSNELMYKSNSTLNAGPQVGIVPTRLL